MPIRRTKSNRKTRNSKRRGNKNYKTKRNTRRYNKVKRGGDGQYDKCLTDTRDSFNNINETERPDEEYIERFCKEEEARNNKLKRKVVNRPETINQ